MGRQLERELMDDEGQAAAYARADFSASNQLFVEAIVRGAPADLRTAVDLGCGPADVTVRIARAMPAVAITAIDGAGPMIAIARAAVRTAKLADRLTIVHGQVPGVALREHAFDAVLSKDMLHHLPDPSVFWHEVVRLGRPGARVYVMDLIRPAAPDDARRIVEAAAGAADRVLREDFYNSLCAAFTIDEVRDQLASAGLDLRVERLGDRHMFVSGHLPE
jgi:ubiquinone/menaquinone biosynthesis C-methylase UbiE